MTRHELQSRQLDALRRLIAALLPSNRFYGDKLRAAGLDEELAGLDEFNQRLPLTTKQQIVDDQLACPPYGTDLTFPLHRYTRLCQTSGTAGKPLRWLDTSESWQWMLDCWAHVFDAAGAEAGDRALFAFSFGPFLGFWTAFEAACQRGLMCIPGGGMSSRARLQTIFDNDVTVLLCTPTYAIRLGEVAVEQGFDLSHAKVRRIIVAGEPGANVPATRAHIERLWPTAAVCDHHGMTEVGPVSFENPKHPGILHVIESAYLAQIIDPETEAPVAAGEVGELVLTTLGRTGSPLLRYRTGDLVRQATLGPDVLGRCELALEGGILGRVDDMVVIRGVNVYPSAVDQLVRAEPDVAEYRVTVRDTDGLAELELSIEPAPGCADPAALSRRLANTLRDAFQLRIPVRLVDPGGLPRFEFKAKRWVRQPKD